MKFPGKTIFFAALFAVVLASTVPAAAADHYLIADQFNNRVIEVDHRGNVVWHFGLGPSDFSPASIIGVNDAQRVGEFTLHLKLQVITVLRNAFLFFASLSGALSF
jgi:hypothetical protein